jgi:hypothetical protein
MIDASEDPEPESVSNPWVEQWASLLDPIKARPLPTQRAP